MNSKNLTFITFTHEMYSVKIEWRKECSLQFPGRNSKLRYISSNLYTPNVYRMYSKISYFQQQYKNHENEKNGNKFNTCDLKAILTDVSRIFLRIRILWIIYWLHILCNLLILRISMHILIFILVIYLSTSWLLLQERDKKLRKVDA